MRFFCRLRTLQQDDDGSNTLGGVCGEGEELRVDECALFKNITTTKEFEDLQFSARQHGSTTYVELLRSLLVHDNSNPMQKSVFTHGDIGTDNIMVKQDPDSSGQYIVTGIIDWEDSCFYPPWPIPRMHCSRSSLADSSQNHMIDRPATGSGDVGCCPASLEWVLYSVPLYVHRQTPSMRGGGGGGSSRQVAWGGRWTIQRFLFFFWAN